MKEEEYTTRRIFKSATTSQYVIRELLQVIVVSELLDPSEEVWIVSPWVSDIVLLDNRSGNYDTINPDWRAREIRLSDISVHLMSQGAKINIVTRGDDHNLIFRLKLEEKAYEQGFENLLNFIIKDELHIKGLLLKEGVLLGSMNITYNGLEINDEYVEYDIDKENIASSRLAFNTYKEGF